MDHTIYFDGRRIIVKSTGQVLAERRREAPMVMGWQDPFGGQFKPSDLRDFDEALAEHVESELLSPKWSRMSLINWLVWVDSNGTWTDKDMKAEGWEPMTKEDAVEHVMQFVREAYETPEEMRALARR